MIGSAANVLFWGILTFSFLVVIHEMGHFFAARAFGIRVHEFMVGLPGPAIRFHGKKTTYGITAIPLGGYVRIAGMEPGEEDELLKPALLAVVRAGRIEPPALAAQLGIPQERAAALLYTLSDWQAVEHVQETAASRNAAAAGGEFGISPTIASDAGYVPLIDVEPSESDDEYFDRVRRGTYRGVGTGRRIVILSMGVVINLVAAITVFTIVLSTFGYYTQSLTLEGTTPGHAAEAAGLQAGDTLTSFNGEPTDDWMSFVAGIGASEPGDRVTVGYERNGVEDEVTVTLGELEETGAAYLGVEVGVVHVKMNPLEAALESITWVGLVFAAIISFFNPDTFQQAMEGARGVVGISIEAAEAIKNGPLDYAWLVALLSLSLGVMNILPIPPLDGGKVLLEIIEKLRGRPLDRGFTIGVSLAGALLLFSFIGYVMYADVVRYFVNT